jgi:DnaK suppressor protein
MAASSGKTPKKPSAKASGKIATKTAAAKASVQKPTKAPAKNPATQASQKAPARKAAPVGKQAAATKSAAAPARKPASSPAATVGNGAKSKSTAMTAKQKTTGPKAAQAAQQKPDKTSRGTAQSRMKNTTKADTAAKPEAPSKPATRSADSPFKNFQPYEPKRDESYMSEQQLSHFRAILLNWRQELMEEVDRTVHHMRDEAANFPDPADRATQEEEFSIELRTRDRERKLIKKIDQTIDRLDQHDFGYCDTCGIEIGLRRLEARPTASQCVDCKSLDEIKERQLHG